jgi:hypothetical protein
MVILKAGILSGQNADDLVWLAENVHERVVCLHISKAVIWLQYKIKIKGEKQ